MAPPSPAARLFARAGPHGRGDLALAVFVVAIVGLLIVPVPPPLLDVLIASSLAVSVVVLLVVLYVGDALAMATFPTLLLLTTLYRLALNVSTSRSILLRANGGEVIRSFGTFVVRGNYLVGAIVFAMLTIVQYVVIAKGAERVAEVAARFALDALPGKQMAIDAELRAGGIDVAESRRRRRTLSRESQFYGAMDGAMKFVKGDVVASLVIIAVNLLGGLAVGVLQRDLSVVDALRRYGLLTIGDGLVTQIPALVTSTAAGLLVTRVASEEQGAPLSRDLGAQLFGNARALWASAGLVTLLAIVPGLPAFPFLVIAAVLFLLARHRVAVDARARRDELAAPENAAGRRAPFVPMVVPWGVDLGAGFVEALDDDSEGSPTLRARLLGVRDEVFQSLGLPLPRPRIAHDLQLPPCGAVIAVNEIPVTTVMPADGRADATWQSLDADARAALTRDLVEATRAAVATHAHELFGVGEAQLLLDGLEEVNPAIVRLLVPKPISQGLLAEVLRRLLEERVSVRDLRTILEAIAAASTTQKDPLELAEAARVSLRRAMTHRLTGGAPSLEVYLLDPVLEDVVRGAITRTSAGAFLTLAPSAARDVVTCVREALREAPPDGSPPVLLTSPDVRRFVRGLTETDFPELIVTSYAELDPDLQLTPRARAATLR